MVFVKEHNLAGQALSECLGSMQGFALSSAPWMGQQVLLGGTRDVGIHDHDLAFFAWAGCEMHPPDAVAPLQHAITPSSNHK